MDKLCLEPSYFTSTCGRQNRTSSSDSTEICRQDRLSSVDSGRMTEGSSVSPSRSAFYDYFDVNEIRSEQVELYDDHILLLLLLLLKEKCSICCCCCCRRCCCYYFICFGEEEVVVIVDNVVAVFVEVEVADVVFDAE